MNPNIQKLRNRLEQEKGKLNQLKLEKRKAELQLTAIDDELRCVEQAQQIIQEVAQITQQQVQVQLSGLVSTALESVFDFPYEFKLEFVQRRGRTEADIYLERQGVKYNPEDSSGGGVVDIISFALRISLWSLRKGIRKVLILDEPFKALSRDLHSRASSLLSLLSKKLGIQIIMVSHSEDLIDGADKVFYVANHGGVSTVKEIL